MYVHNYVCLYIYIHIDIALQHSHMSKSHIIYKRAFREKLYRSFKKPCL